MMNPEIFKQIEEAIVTMDAETARRLAAALLDTGTSGGELLDRALIPALDRVGALFGSGEYFLPEMLMCVHIYTGIFARIEPELKGAAARLRGRIMLGTVAGDNHDIGKNIVAALLQGSGFEVVDIGFNVPAAAFLAKARQFRPQVIGLSALLTTTMPEMKAVIDLFKTEGDRDDYRFIVGGAPVTQAFADEIGADGYGEDAQAGVQLVRRLVG